MPKLKYQPDEQGTAPVIAGENQAVIAQGPAMYLIDHVAYSLPFQSVAGLSGEARKDGVIRW